jgi:hypothetical protein
MQSAINTEGSTAKNIALAFNCNADTAELRSRVIQNLVRTKNIEVTNAIQIEIENGRNPSIVEKIVNETQKLITNNQEFKDFCIQKANLVLSINAKAGLPPEMCVILARSEKLKVIFDGNIAIIKAALKSASDAEKSFKKRASIKNASKIGGSSSTLDPEQQIDLVNYIFLKNAQDAAEKALKAYIQIDENQADIIKTQLETKMEGKDLQLFKIMQSTLQIENNTRDIQFLKTCLSTVLNFDPSSITEVNPIELGTTQNLQTVYSDLLNGRFDNNLEAFENSSSLNIANMESLPIISDTPNIINFPIMPTNQNSENRTNNDLQEEDLFLKDNSFLWPDVASNMATADVPPNTATAIAPVTQDFDFGFDFNFDFDSDPLGLYNLFKDS